MVRIILFIVTSLDGYIADENGNVDWLLSSNQNEDYGFQAFYRSVNALIMGSKTYERFLTYGDWPYLDKKTYVFTRRPLTTKLKNIQFVNDVNVFIDTLRKENIHEELMRDESVTQTLWLVGGSKLITAFYNQALIDEYIITIIPKEIKKGIILPKPIKDNEGLITLETNYFDDGVVRKHLINA